MSAEDHKTGFQVQIDPEIERYLIPWAKGVVYMPVVRSYTAAGIVWDGPHGVFRELSEEDEDRLERALLRIPAPDLRLLKRYYGHFIRYEERPDWGDYVYLSMIAATERVKLEFFGG